MKCGKRRSFVKNQSKNFKTIKNVGTTCALLVWHTCNTYFRSCAFKNTLNIKSVSISNGISVFISLYCASDPKTTRFLIRKICREIIHQESQQLLRSRPFRSGITRSIRSHHKLAGAFETRKLNIKSAFFVLNCALFDIFHVLVHPADNIDDW